LGIFSSILLLVCLGANAKSHSVKTTKLKISHGLTWNVENKDRVSIDVKKIQSY
jgi:hypothetical protein